MTTEIRSGTQGGTSPACEPVFEPTQHACRFHQVSGLYSQIIYWSQEHHLVTRNWFRICRDDEERVYVTATQSSAHIRLGCVCFTRLWLSQASPSTVCLHPSPPRSPWPPWAEDSGLALQRAFSRSCGSAKPGGQQAHLPRKVLLLLLRWALWQLAHRIPVTTY